MSIPAADPALGPAAAYTKLGGFKVQGLGHVIFVRNAPHTGVAEDTFAKRFGYNAATMFRACRVDWVDDVYDLKVQANNQYGVKNPEVIIL